MKKLNIFFLLCVALNVQAQDAQITLEKKSVESKKVVVTHENVIHENVVNLNAQVALKKEGLKTANAETAEVKKTKVEKVIIAKADDKIQDVANLQHKIDDKDSAVVIAKVEKPKAPQVPQRFLLDTIEAVVFGEEGAEIITLSDTQRLGLDGQTRTRDDLIQERLMYLDAKKYKMIGDEEAVDRHLASVQREHNMSQEDIKSMFREAGYTYEEGRAQFGMMQAVNNIMNFRIYSRLLVPESKIVKYYKENPQEQEARYQLERAVVSVGAGTTSEVVKSELLEYAKVGKNPKGLEWDNPFWIANSDIADNKSFIRSMKKGQISEPLELNNSFEVYRLKERKDHRLLALDERRLDIENTLRKPRFDALFAKYKQQLVDSSSVLYLTS